MHTDDSFVKISKLAKAILKNKIKYKTCNTIITVKNALFEKKKPSKKTKLVFLCPICWKKRKRIEVLFSI